MVIYSDEAKNYVYSFIGTFTDVSGCQMWCVPPTDENHTAHRTSCVTECSNECSNGERRNSRISSSNRTSCVTGRPCSYADVVDFRVVVITFRRPDSLKKLLRTLNLLVVDRYSASLEIWIDRDHRTGTIDRRTFEVASTFNWKGGPTRVHIQVRCGERVDVRLQWLFLFSNTLCTRAFQKVTITTEIGKNGAIKLNFYTYACHLSIFT